ncbi:MAG: Protein-arginine kinase [bacterium]|nr:Protein-arginine kinase [bacterium]
MPNDKALEFSKTTVRNLNTLVKRMPRWLENEAPKANIVISTRVRLARNLEGHAFPNAAEKEELYAVIREVYDALASSPQLAGPMFLDMLRLGKLERKFLVERRLISPPYAESDNPAMLVVGEDECLSVMVNEEDHLRLQSIQPGLNVEEAWRLMALLDDDLGEHLDYAFTDQFGYLTACPTNTGTGMRVSLFVHLPALALLEELEKIFKKLAPSEITVRGFYGEGTEVVGNVFQISNQLTLGRTDDSIVKRMEEVGEKLVSLEDEARERVLDEQVVQIYDKVYRAIGIMKYARVLTSLELLNLLSYLRLGFDLGIFKNTDRSFLNELMVTLQPAHIQKKYRDMEDELPRDVHRAHIVREKISALF